jgi:hypothetical protein
MIVRRTDRAGSGIALPAFSFADQAGTAALCRPRAAVAFTEY